MGKISALIHSQRVHNNIEIFDIHLKELTNNKEIVLECRDKEHALVLAQLIGKCVNFVSDYKVLNKHEVIDGD